MFSLGTATRAFARSVTPSTGRRSMVIPIKKALIKAGETEAPADVPALEKRMEEMAEKDATMVFDSGINLPDPMLPDNPAEITALDAAHLTSVLMPDGRQRMVVIKQMRARPNQSPLNPEKIWKISFNDDGAVGERWKNSLMGWNSTADTMGCDTPLYFRNAQDAVYFAKKRGWKYLVKEPIIRKLRDDDAQYQDNFLPQAIASQVKKEGIQCDHWKRAEAGCSHYFRPLKYHGDGVVRQHGPNMLAESAPHTQSYFKISFREEESGNQLFVFIWMNGVSTMTQTVTLPVFGSANSQAQSSAEVDQNGTHNEWQIDSSGDPMDFDLLAEYLLEDNPSSSAGINFDFNGESANISSVVSPEQSVDGRVFSENGAIQAQRIISHHAAGIHQEPLSQHHNQIHLATTGRPAPAPLAPAPSSHMNGQSTMVAAQGISLPVVGGASYLQHTTHIAPAPAHSSGSINTAVAQQPSVAVTKRRRVENPSSSIGGNQVLSDPMAVAAALQGRGRKKTQAQIDRRRERNRILARRTRLRKKFFFESLQKEVVDLQRENAALKDIVRTELDDDGKKLLDECDAMERMPQGVLEACGENANEYDQQDFNLVRSIQQSQHSFVITDPSLQDNPIVFASDDFLNLTGYSREEVLGRNCRFLQGTDTDQRKLDEIRKCLSSGDDVSVTLLNYTADGTPFWNKLFIAALRDAQNNIVNFIGVIVKIANPEPGDPEYGKSLPGEQETYGDDSVCDSEDQSAGITADGTVQNVDGSVDPSVAAVPSFLD